MKDPQARDNVHVDSSDFFLLQCNTVISLGYQRLQIRNALTITNVTCTAHARKPISDSRYVDFQNINKQ